MIPQDPVLFMGTIKSNIDPLGHFEDHAIIQALQRVQLYDCILSKIDKKQTEITTTDVLNVKVDLEGSNFSHGEM